MFNRVSHLLYPIKDIDSVTDIRSAIWQSLVKSVLSSDEDSIERTAFVLFISRLANCHQCHSDSYKALHGCKDCGRYTIKRNQASDSELQDLYEQARQDVIEYSLDLSTRLTK